MKVKSLKSVIDFAEDCRIAMVEVNGEKFTFTNKQGVGVVDYTLNEHDGVLQIPCDNNTYFFDVEKIGVIKWQM